MQVVCLWCSLGLSSAVTGHRIALILGSELQVVCRVPAWLRGVCGLRTADGRDTRRKHRGDARRSLLLESLFSAAEQAMQTKYGRFFRPRCRIKITFEWSVGRSYTWRKKYGQLYLFLTMFPFSAEPLRGIEEEPNCVRRAASGRVCEGDAELAADN